MLGPGGGGGVSREGGGGGGGVSREGGGGEGGVSRPTLVGVAGVGLTYRQSVHFTTVIPKSQTQRYGTMTEFLVMNAINNQRTCT